VADAALGEGRGKLSHPRIGLAPGKALGPVHHRRMVGIDTGRPFQERIRRQGGVIGANGVQRLFVHIDFAQVGLRLNPLHSGPFVDCGPEGQCATKHLGKKRCFGPHCPDKRRSLGTGDRAAKRPKR
jgi:hypothetical protein